MRYSSHKASIFACALVAAVPKQRSHELQAAHLAEKLGPLQLAQQESKRLLLPRSEPKAGIAMMPVLMSMSGLRKENELKKNVAETWDNGLAGKA